MTTRPDFLDPDVYLDGIPYRLLAEIRAQDPVHWVDEPARGQFAGGPGYWLVLSHELVSEVSRRPADFSSWRGTAFLREQRPTDVEVLRRMMLHMDPPEHTKLRKIVNKAFVPNAIRKHLGDAIDRHAREVVDSVCEAGSADLLGDIAAEMPLLVLADILGVPAEDRHLLYSWTNALVGIDDPEYGGDPKVFLRAFGEMFKYARAQTAGKRANPGDDVWSLVVNAEVDGDRLSDDDLDRFFQLLMIAGNETTRALIAGGMETLFKHPDQFDRLRGDLELLPSAIEEMLRFTPSVMQFRRTVTRDLELGGKLLRENDRVVINYAAANRDPAVFDRPDEFDIGREHNRHISFGDGTHFCLGSNLARLQVRVLLTELLTRLPDIRPTGPAERMRSNFVNGIKRLPVEFTPAPQRGAIKPSSNIVATPPELVHSKAPSHGTPLHIFFGSNFGTAEETAQVLAEEAGRRGFVPTTADLDDAVSALPTDGPVLVVTATYNGTPPDNAGLFAAAVRDSALDASGVKFSVFGCGNSEWIQTFQQYPRAVDIGLEVAGGTRIHNRGEGDAAGDFDESFEGWLSGLWPALAATYGLSEADLVVGAKAKKLTMRVVSSTPPSPFVASRGAVPMRITASRSLTRDRDGVDVKPVRHIEFCLPVGTTYAAGDHLGVIPHNGPEIVERVADRFDMDPDTVLMLGAADPDSTILPVGQRVSVRTLLTDYLELQGVATRRMVEVVAAHTRYPSAARDLAQLLGDSEAFRAAVTTPRKSLIDLLEEYPAVELPFEEYLDLLLPLAPRYYSISSSPHSGAGVCTVTVGVLREPARCGSRHTYSGVCSTYLDGKDIGDEVYAFVRDTASTFRLPADPATPVIMIGSGTGIAPFRGFLQERAGRAESGTDLGDALLIVGARHPQADLLYADELRGFAAAGVARIEHAFSRIPNAPKTYVQDRVRDLADELLALLEYGAYVYICGSSAMSDGVAQAFVDIYAAHRGRGREKAQAWFAELSSSHRYNVDVWAAG